MAEEQQSANTAKLLEQVHSLLHHKAKQRDLARAGLQSLQEQLEAQRKVLEGFEHDVDSLQQQAGKLLAAVTGHSHATKRSGALLPECARILDVLGKEDDVLSTPEYVLYRSEAVNSGQGALCPLRWHLRRLLDTLDESGTEPPAKRTCTVRAGGEHMEESYT